MTQEFKLIQSAKDGEVQAFQQIVEKYQALICSITLSKVGRVDLSEELAQDTFLNAWKNIKQLKDPHGFKAWLCTIANNVVKNYFRKKKTVPLDVNDAANIPDENPSPAENIIIKEELAMLEDALKQIPTEYSEPFILYYRKSQSIRQVALELELTESTVHTRLSRARQMLRENIAKRIERTIEKTAPSKAFTTAVMASIGVAAIKGTAATAAAVSTSGTSGISAFISSALVAKIISATAIAAIIVTAGIIYHHNSEDKNQIPTISQQSEVVKKVSPTIQTEQNTQLQETKEPTATAPSAANHQT